MCLCIGASNTLTVERIKVNDNRLQRKSIFKKKKRPIGSSADNSPHSSRGPSPAPLADDGEAGKEKEKKKKISFKKFKNVAKAVKIGRSISKTKGNVDEHDGLTNSGGSKEGAEEDGDNRELEEEGGSRESVNENQEKRGNKGGEKAAPTRPDTIPIQPCPLQEATPTPLKTQAQ